jgi:hypothetical protein
MAQDRVTRGYVIVGMLALRAIISGVHIIS